MTESEEFAMRQLGRALGNEAAFEALLVAVMSEQPILREKFITNLSAQQSKGERNLDGAALESFSERLKRLQREVNAL